MPALTDFDAGLAALAPLESLRSIGNCAVWEAYGGRNAALLAVLVLCIVSWLVGCCCGGASVGWYHGPPREVLPYRRPKRGSEDRHTIHRRTSVAREAVDSSSESGSSQEFARLRGGLLDGVVGDHARRGHLPRAPGRGLSRGHGSTRTRSSSPRDHEAEWESLGQSTGSPIQASSST